MADEAGVRDAVCACGDLRLRLRGEPQFVSGCACQACQRRTGAPFGVTAFYSPDQVVQHQGETRTWRRIADSGRWLDYRFCPRCGSTIWWEAQVRPGLLAVAGGAFAGRDCPAPQRMVWAEHRADWVRLPDGIPEYPQGLPDRAQTTAAIAAGCDQPTERA